MEETAELIRPRYDLHPNGFERRSPDDCDDSVLYVAASRAFPFVLRNPPVNGLLSGFKKYGQFRCEHGCCSIGPYCDLAAGWRGADNRRDERKRELLRGTGNLRSTRKPIQSSSRHERETRWTQRDIAS